MSLVCEVDVVVIGAGPVGMTVALLLGRRGRQVLVLERQAAPFGRPRAVHLDGHAARVLQGAGIMDRLALQTEPMDAYEWRNATGETLLKLTGDLRSGCWPSSSMFSQPHLEALLEQQLAACPTTELRRNAEVGAVVPRAGGVEVAAGDLRVGCQWVVACDGARSTCRDLVGIRAEDLGYEHDWIVADVVLRQPMSWSPLNVQFCDPRRPTTAVSGGPGRRRFEFMVLPGESPAALTAADRIWELLAPWLSPGQASIERVASYRYSARLATSWRAGRVLLAGDAAHQMPPFAGQGLCSGLKDAAAVAWRLDAVLGGAASESILDSYGTERRPQVAAEIEFSVELGNIICVLDSAAAAERDAAMIAAYRETGPIVPPPAPLPGPGLFRHADPGAGLLCPPGRVSVAGHARRVEDLLMEGWALIAAAPPAPGWLTGPVVHRWASAGGRVVDLSASGRRDTRDVDLDGTYATWLGELGVAAAMVRPDFYVYATAAHPASVATTVPDLRWPPWRS